jgi:hypothetical protein
LHSQLFHLRFSCSQLPGVLNSEYLLSY